MENTIEAKSLSHFFLIFIAVQKPASKAVVTQVARKYERLYRLARGSGDSKPVIFAKFLAVYNHNSEITRVCQTVSRLERRLERVRRRGGP